MSQKITIAYGDGIGPEIMTLVLDVLAKAGAEFQKDVIQLGEKIYKQGHLSGIKPESWDIIRKNKVFLKAPITTPQGEGFQSLNVQIRKNLGLFANIRPVQSLHPYIHTHFPGMDVVVVRENEEDLYAGIEYQQSQELFQCLKLISLPACQKITKYAFEYAKSMGRSKVTCMTKDNIMKLTDGAFHRVFNEVAKDYPDIKNEHWIVDIGMAKVATQALAFDVIVLPNLYGDILSDISAQIAGSVGIGGSSNIGVNHAMFEAIHGSAPKRAGQNMANPSALLQASIMMLNHIEEYAIAKKISNAWLKTIEDGLHTYDIYNEKTSKQKLSTTDFGKAIISNLGAEPKHLKSSLISNKPTTIKIALSPIKKQKQTLDGIDVFVHEDNRDPRLLAKALQEACKNHNCLKLQHISNRGVKVYPETHSEIFCTDHWACRFVKTSDILNPEQLIDLLKDLVCAKILVIKTENLYSFNNKQAYS